ncbi:MAG TPA: sugar phosphate nucleotidyltransferase [Aggregatilineales bacterium]|nr:sugar phosphate nucleotidyltransferase [Aggregatilineales bacterium]
MKVIIPLAGFGTRLRPHTFTKPKPLINVAGKPVLGHLLDKIAGLPIDEYIFIVGYLGEQVEEYVTTKYKIPARFIEQRELLGQAHAIWLAREHLNNDSVFIIFVDTLFETNLSGLSQPDGDSLIFVKEVEDPRPFGVVTLNDQGYITQFVEKPESVENKLVVVGLYYFEQSNPLISAIDDLMTQKKMTKNEYFLADAMQLMIERGVRFKPRRVSEWLDCGRPDTVLATNRYLLKHENDNSEQIIDKEGVIIIPPVNISPTAKIKNSVIGPYVTIGANCVIDSCILRDTIIDDGARCENSLLEQSLIGRNAVVEGRFRTLNVGDSSAVGFS